MDADSILLTDITGIVRASKGERIAPAEVLKRHVRHAAKPAYTKFAIHQRAHSGIVARAGQLKAKLDAGEITLGAVVDFLAHDVVARHMLTADREFFPLFLSPATPSAA